MPKQHLPTRKSAMAKFKKKKFPCVRKLFSTTNARMTSALPRTVARTSSVMSTARNTEVDEENWPYCRARRFSSSRGVAFPRETVDQFIASKPCDSLLIGKRVEVPKLRDGAANAVCMAAAIH